MPSQPPPSKRPPPTPTSSNPEFNYETEETFGNGEDGAEIPIEEDTYEDVTIHHTTTSPPPSSSSSLLLPPSQSSSSLASPQHSPTGTLSTTPTPSPTLGRKSKLTKEERKQLKEEERKERERKKQDELREKERKKKEEIQTKNKIKGLKAHKQFSLPNDVKPLFSVEILMDMGRGKDHMASVKGDMMHVLLINHPKLPEGRYLVEKEDGTIGYVNKSITKRSAYQSVQAALPEQDGAVPQIEEDIYESLPQDDDESATDGFGAAMTTTSPTLPPPNPGLPAPNPGRFPPPSAPAPPPPSDPTSPPPAAAAEEDLYESLPDGP